MCAPINRNRPTAPAIQIPGLHAQWQETQSLNWYLADDMWHRDVMDSVRSLLKLYKERGVLYTDARNSVTFEWVNRGDYFRNTISYMRRNPWNYEQALLVVCNFSPMQYNGYTVGAPIPGSYRRVFSSFDSTPGCGGPQERGGEYPVLLSDNRECDGYPCTLTYDLRPYESIILEVPTP